MRIVQLEQPGPASFQLARLFELASNLAVDRCGSAPCTPCSRVGDSYRIVLFLCSMSGLGGNRPIDLAHLRPIPATTESAPLDVLDAAIVNQGAEFGL